MNPPGRGHRVDKYTHLRYPFGRDESAALDGGDARPGQPLNQLDLGGEGDDLLLVLKAVAGADLDYPHGIVGAPLLLLLLLLRRGPWVSNIGCRRVTPYIRSRGGADGGCARPDGRRSPEGYGADHHRWAY